jgi:hypothetical protein
MKKLLSKDDTIVFETEYLRYLVSKTGWNRSVFDLGSGVEYCRQPGRYPFMSFGEDPKGAPMGIVRKGNQLLISFVQHGSYALVEVTVKPHYLVFELMELKGCGGEAVFKMASLGVAVTEHVGKFLNVAWNKSFGICLLALNMKSQAYADTVHEPAVVRPVLTLQTHAGLGHVGGKYALIGAPKSELENVIAEVARDYGLPCPKDEHGVPMKKSYRSQRSYIFLTHMGKKYEDFALDMAEKGGFGLIMNDYYWTYNSFGSYVFRKKQWPRGLNDLAAWSKRCHKAGLQVGFHSMSSCVADNDPLVAEGTGNGFVPDGGNVLAEDISAKSTAIPVLLPPYGKLAKGIFRIDDELISVGDNRTLSQLVAVSSSNAPVSSKCSHFADVRRGVNGTRAASHRKGAPMIHFCTRYGFCPDIDGAVADKVAARLAEIMNRCGMDMIYLDGLEGVHDAGWCNVPKFVMNFYQRLERKNVIIQASHYEHFLWHFLTRANSGDTAVCYDETSTEHVRAKEVCFMSKYYDNLLRPVFDWHGWNFYNSDSPMGICLKPTEATTLRDWVVYLDAARRLDVPLGVLAGIPDLKKNPDTVKMLAMTREYEQERIKRLFGENLCTCISAAVSSDWRLL